MLIESENHRALEIDGTLKLMSFQQLLAIGRDNFP